ncbi:hypothetical protein E2C01_102553 [Portunus trituberculatus]|uniref:Uncharacterized protein n=1 Tax=Portunus trituberculatus TaxID=210409 RepID=A0A5B7KMV9_PORTR|nr:hypothetical protein [Portunus trituberculatus]
MPPHSRHSRTLHSVILDLISVFFKGLAPSLGPFLPCFVALCQDKRCDVAAFENTRRRLPLRPVPLLDSSRPETLPCATEHVLNCLCPFHLPAPFPPLPASSRPNTPVTACSAAPVAEVYDPQAQGLVCTCCCQTTPITADVQL